MVASFRAGQRLFLTVMNEQASPMYTSDFLCRLFEQESQGLFDAREVVLGQTQQGGAPTPFDRILATRLAAHSMDWLRDQIDAGRSGGAVIGMQEGRVRVLSLRAPRSSRTGSTGVRWTSGGCDCARSLTCWATGSRRAGAPTSVDRLKRGHRRGGRASGTGSAARPGKGQLGPHPGE